MRKILFLLFILIATKGFSQSTKENRIDLELKNCLDSTQNCTTAGMSNCIIKATEKWDKQLNENYKKLLSLASEGQKIKLKESQRKWIEFRDKELEFSNELYSSFEGTMWIPVMYETRLKLTKQRTLELQKYIDNIEIK